MLKKGSRNCKFFRLLSVRVKTRQIPHVSFDKQVNSPPTFGSFFIVMTHSSSVNFKLLHFLLWMKVFLQHSNLETFKWSGKNLPNSSCPFPNYKSFFHEIFYHSLVSCKITPLYFFSSNSIYFAQEKSIKVEFLRLLSAWVKICQTPHVSFFLKKVSSTPNFALLLSVTKDISSVLKQHIICSKGAHESENL